MVIDVYLQNYWCIPNIVKTGFEILGYLGKTAFRSHQVDDEDEDGVPAIHMHFCIYILISQIQSL